MITHWLYLAAFGPIFLFTLYSVARDPITPHYIWEFGYTIFFSPSKLFSFLLHYTVIDIELEMFTGI